MSFIENLKGKFTETKKPENPSIPLSFTHDFFGDLQRPTIYKPAKNSNLFILEPTHNSLEISLQNPDIIDFTDRVTTLLTATKPKIITNPDSEN